VPTWITDHPFLVGGGLFVLAYAVFLRWVIRLNAKREKALREGPDPIIELTERERHKLVGYLTVRANGSEHRPGGLVDLTTGEEHEKALRDVEYVQDTANTLTANRLEQLVEAISHVPAKHYAAARIRWEEAGFGEVEYAQKMRLRIHEARQRMLLSPSAQARQDAWTARWQRLEPHLRPWRHMGLLSVLAVAVMVRIGRYDPTATVVFLALTLLIAHTLYFSAWKEAHGQAPDDDPSLPRPVRSEDERYARALAMLYVGGCTFITLIALIARTGVGGGDDSWASSW